MAMCTKCLWFHRFHSGEYLHVHIPRRCLICSAILLSIAFIGLLTLMFLFGRILAPASSNVTNQSVLFTALLTNLSALLPAIVRTSFAQETCTSRMASTFAPTFDSTYSVSYVTAPNDEVATKIAEGLVKNKLAACVNILPNVKSIYEWKGNIEKDAEVLMMIKSRASKLEELTNFVKANHPYEVCEVISVPIQQGNPEYLKWINDVVPEK